MSERKIKVDPRRLKIAAGFAQVYQVYQAKVPIRLKHISASKPHTQSPVKFPIPTFKRRLGGSTECGDAKSYGPCDAERINYVCVIDNVPHTCKQHPPPPLAWVPQWPIPPQSPIRIPFK